MGIKCFCRQAESSNRGMGKQSADHRMDSEAGHWGLTAWSTSWSLWLPISLPIPASLALFSLPRSPLSLFLSTSSLSFFSSLSLSTSSLSFSLSLPLSNSPISLAPSHPPLQHISLLPFLPPFLYTSSREIMSPLTPPSPVQPTTFPFLGYHSICFSLSF